MLRKRNQPTRRPTVSSNQAPVFSYYASRSREADPIRKYTSTDSRQRLIGRQWLRNLPAILTIITILVSIIYCTSLSTRATVMLPINPKTKRIRERTVYQAGAQKILSGSLLNQSKLTFNSVDFANKFTTAFPEIATVNVTLPLVSRHPIVLIQTAQPELVLTAGSQAFVVDNRGMVIFKATDIDSSLRDTLPVVHDQTGLSISLGKRVLSKTYIDFITTVTQQLAAQQLAVESVVLPPIAQQINFKISGLPYIVKYNVAIDARLATGSFLAARQKLLADSTTPSEYIDVRVEERVYYK